MLFHSNSRVLKTKKGQSQMGTSAVVELLTLNAEVQGVNLALSGFSLNANCSEIFPSHPPLFSCNSLNQPSSTIIYPSPCSFPSRHLVLYCFSHCSNRAGFTQNLSTTIRAASLTQCLAHIVGMQKNSHRINQQMFHCNRENTKAPTSPKKDEL